ncbi:hypothetical protein SASPL_123288 [Salvia splendens]|uniref:Uncharacterized protein n=1 Tax=Salvia splendens TaxID=180675 RepID=A0A8X8XNS2_SALSN|nr:hypothetical protein SASPL_123288 [Salvia splendens]
MSLQLLSPANEVPFATPDVVPILQPYYGGNEAPVPIPVPASPTVSTKRAAEVDLRNEEDSESDCFKIQKCEGNEFSDALDELKKLEDMFDSKLSNEFSPF